MAQKNQWPGAFAAYRATFEQLKANPAPVLLYVGTYALLTVVSLVLQGKVSYADEHAPYEDIVTLIFWLALPIYGLAIADRRSITIAEFMRFNLKKYVILLVVTVLTLLIVGASLILLIVPAIWTIAWLSMISYTVVDKSLGPIQALRESKRLTRAHLSKVWGLIGVSMLVVIPALILSFIPYIGIMASALATVFTYGAWAILYRWLQYQKV